MSDPIASPIASAEPDPPTEPSPPAKVDPETLVLRGRPRRVVRFRRGVIIAAAALGSTAIVGVTWFALKPATFHIVAEGEDRSDAGAKRPPDALANAPRTYGDVPSSGRRCPAISAARLPMPAFPLPECRQAPIPSSSASPKSRRRHGQASCSPP